MNLIDSSGWLEYFADGKNSDFFAFPIEDISKVVVSTINLFEVYKKILFERDEQNAMAAISFMAKANIIPVDDEIAIEAANLSLNLKLPLADSIIYATAIKANAIVYTQDSHFEGLQFVKYIKK
jgi:toxin FitB